ncbi:MAG: AlwI family type II restriction endonuclease [bacterium]|nr:AlwI family type II restriction endonuclease [bacterium]
MKKIWSLSTTVRNPERIQPFLNVLKEMEGGAFDEAGQVKFQTLLIQNRLYQPTGLSNAMLEYYETAGDKMSFEQAREIFEHMKSRSTVLRGDEGLRGRTSVAPLTKMGLAIAKQTSGDIKITDLGKAFLKNEIDIGDVYFRFFIKWQIPNPESTEFSDDGTYNIKPFIGALHLIDRVNKKEIGRGNEPKGLSKNEFDLFVPSLVNFNDIDSYAGKIIALRDLMDGKSKQEKRQVLNDYSREFAVDFLGTDDTAEVDKLISNLSDYGDNAIRYFRLTRYFHIRGGGFYIDLEPRRSVEISNLLAHDNAKAETFASKEAYLDYVSDITQPKLPWETKEKLSEIIEKLIGEVTEYENRLGLAEAHRLTYSSFSESELKAYAEELRIYRRSLQDKENHNISQNVEKIKEYITALENIFQAEDKPIALEKYVSLGLNALNDALQIKPNYPVGDDNEPTFTAPANTPDIECFYESHNAICEVTMLTGRDQWYNEGQPVMRHLRDFENKDTSKVSYCLFVAPKLHRDTVNTFWTSIKYEYEGRPQKIIPLSIGQFIQLLKALVVIKERGGFLNHTQLSQLFDSIVGKSSTATNASEWLDEIPAVIDTWQTALTT